MCKEFWLPSPTINIIIVVVVNVVVVPDVPRFPTAARTNPCWNIIYTLNFGGYNAARNIQCKLAPKQIAQYPHPPIRSIPIDFRCAISFAITITITITITEN